MDIAPLACPLWPSPDRSSRRADEILATILFGLYGLLAIVVWWCVENWLPDQLTISISGSAFSLNELHRRIGGAASAMALVLPPIFIIEIGCVGWRGSSLRHLLRRQSASAKTDAVCFLLQQTHIRLVLGWVFSLGVTLVSGAWLHTRLEAITGLSLSVESLPVAAQFLSFFLIYSFCDYWSHRADHSALFWPLHRFHHAAETFDVLTSVRTHPAAFTDVISRVLPLAIVAVSPDVVIDVGLFVVVHRYLIHSRIAWDFGWIGRNLLQSPVHHRYHHTIVDSEAGAHFSLVPLWDRLFGTWRGAFERDLAIGVATRYCHGAWLVPDLWRDYCEFWAAVLAGCRPESRVRPRAQGLKDDNAITADAEPA